jgi:gliding motility-associated-like protein
MKKVLATFRLVVFTLAGILLFSGLRAQCPTVNITPSAACSSTPVQLNASAGFTNYSWSPASGLSNPNISNPIASSSGTYQVIASSTGPNIIVNPDFSSGNTGFTSGQFYTTTYSPCNYYVGPIWFSSYFPTLTDHTPTTDNYFMHIDGCTSVTSIWSETVAVTPNTNYTFSYWASRADQVQPIFEIHFTGNATGNVVMNTITGIPYTGTWMWDQYGIPSWNSGANTSVTLEVVNLETNGYGNDFGLDDFLFQQICTDSATVNVTIAPSPALGPDTLICGNGNITLNAGPANSYLWNTGDTLQTINVSATGQYIVNTTVPGCTFSDTINVSIHPLPVVDIGNDTTLCPGETIVLDATGAPENVYQWNNNSTTATQTVNATGNYSVAVSYFGCTAFDSVQIVVLPPLHLGDEISLCGKYNLTLDAANPGATYLWSNGSTSPSIDITDPGIYSVIVSNGACVLSDSVVVTGNEGEGLLFIPNTFTPNRNNVNDIFKAYGEGIVTFHMRIFDRWGNMIFETQDMNAGWDGTYKGNIVQIDTYAYTIDYETECNGGERKAIYGHVNVIK